MVEEPQNLRRQLLRKIRATSERHDTRFDKADRSLAHIEQRVDGPHETMYTMVGFAMHANVRRDTVTGRPSPLEQRVAHLEEKA